MTDRELDEILIHRWPILMRHVLVHGDAWARGFVRSIARQGKRPNWRPTPKQEALMRRLLAELAMHDSGPADVIDDERGQVRVA